VIKASYIDHMGNDLSVVNAARVSFGKQSNWTYTEGYDRRPELSKSDAKLIKYLAKHNHISPFGHAFASFHIKAPIFVARQLVKHKFLRWNEISRRYVDSEPEFYEPSEWRGRSKDKKQGSDGIVDVEDWGDTSWACLTAYKDLLEHGVCPEQARMVLPQNTMTEWHWSGSLDAFASMCQLRCKPDTQLETRLVADQISTKMSELYSVSWQSLIESSNDS
jgi:thymidylate synthase (FAD)